MERRHGYGYRREIYERAADRIPRDGRTVEPIKKEKTEKPKKQNIEKFVRYDEGAKLYHMGISKFQEIAKEAKACYKIGHLVLVNTEIIDDGFEEDEEPEYSYVAPFAVYMVKYGLDRCIYVDDQSKRELKEIFDAMCRIEYEETKTDEPPPEDETEEETETESESETETETEEEKETDVKVTIYRMTAEEAAEFYDFSDEEIEQMNAFIELVEKGLEY